jgi:predicted nucleic acid-binding Zn ribbon protein
MSKFMREAQPKVVKHRHCTMCHTPVLDMDKEFCSQKCQDEFKKIERNRKYTTFLMVLLFPTIILIMMLLRPS